jgi:hypothetical protein
LDDIESKKMGLRLIRVCNPKTKSIKIWWRLVLQRKLSVKRKPEK